MLTTQEIQAMREKAMLNSVLGKCRYPLSWGDGTPLVLCPETAYGRVKSASDPAALACPDHGGPRVEYKLDGNQWCATVEGFINLQESPAGFGETRPDALEGLHRELATPAILDRLPKPEGRG